MIDYIFNELDQDTRKDMESHLTTCENCRNTAEETQNAVAFMRKMEEKDPPRLLYFKNKKNVIIEFLNQKSIFALAACILLVLTAFMLVKFYEINSPHDNAMNQNSPLRKSEAETMISKALNDYSGKQNILINSQFQQLEKKLVNNQNQQLTVFKDSMNKHTQDFINTALNTNENEHINDLKQVADTIQKMHQRNQLEQAQTNEILNYLINASEKRKKY